MAELPMNRQLIIYHWVRTQTYSVVILDGDAAITLLTRSVNPLRPDDIVIKACRDFCTPLLDQLDGPLVYSPTPVQVQG